MKNENCFDELKRFAKVLFFLLIPLVVVPILATWAGDVLKKCIDNGTTVSQSDLIFLAVSTAGLFGLAVLIVSKGRALLPARVIEQTPRIKQRRVLIALLSPCDNLEKQSNEDGIVGWNVLDKKDNKAFPLFSQPLEKIVSANSGLPPWTWQQTLRAACHHKIRLEKLVLVSSRGGSGTDKQLNYAYDFFSTYFPEKVVIFGRPENGDGQCDVRWQADFEDLSGLSLLLRNIIGEILKDTAGYTEQDVIIDCTGGYKTASIAVALVTLDRPNLMFQYVGTGEHAGQVFGFNVVTEHYAG